jgi:hypothetical protein
MMQELKDFVFKIPLIWTKILSYGGNYKNVKMYIRITLSANIIVTLMQLGIIGAISFSFLPVDSDHFFKAHYDSVDDLNLFSEYTTMIRALIMSFSLLWFSVWLLVYGIRIYLVLTSSDVRPASSPARYQRVKSILKVIFVVVACSLCYLLRAFTVTLITYDYFSDSYYTDVWFSFIGWYICSQWAPTLIPVCCILCLKYIFHSSSCVQAMIMLFVCRPIARRKTVGMRELGSLGRTSDDYSRNSEAPSFSANHVNPLQSKEVFHSVRTATSSENNNNVPGGSSSSSGAQQFRSHYDSPMDFDSVDYDYDESNGEGFLSPGHPVTVDEILASSDIYGASAGYEYDRESYYNQN